MKHLFSSWQRPFFKKLDLFKQRSFLSRHGILCHNISQFTNVIDDNIFKLLVVFFLIDLEGISATNTILFKVGTVYVIPFLLFSVAGGTLADRFSKQKLLFGLKCSEFFIICIGIIGFLFKNVLTSYSVLFLLSLQSALFGPSKYGLIPEMLPSEKIPKGNGLITSFTYLGMIVGTFLGSFLTQISDHRFAIAALPCALFSLLGAIGAYFVPSTLAQRNSKKIDLFFLRDIFKTLSETKQNKLLLFSILGSAFFLFVGAFFQLNLIPYAIQALHTSEVEGGYLFLIVAVGIAFGAFLTGKILGKKIEITPSIIAGFLLFIFLFLLGILHNHLFTTLSLLFATGFVGGCFIVPFDVYIQAFGDEKKRGQLIAASNFLGFCGVLLAPTCIYVFGTLLHLPASVGFIIISFTILSFNILLLAKFGDLALSRFIYFFPSIRKNSHVLSHELASPCYILYHEKSFRALAFLLSVSPNTKLTVYTNKFSLWKFFSFVEVEEALHIPDLSSGIHAIDISHLSQAERVKIAKKIKGKAYYLHYSESDKKFNLKKIM